MAGKETLKEYVDENVSFRDWNRDAGEKLSLQLAGKYDFQKVAMLGEDFLLLSPKNEDTLPILTRDKAKVEAASGMPAAFYFDHVSSFRKKNLLKNRVAFIDADKEIYLPFIALRLKNQAQEDRLLHGEYAEPFTPGTQLVFLYLLYQPVREFTMSQISAELGISVMTAQRALQALYSRGLVTFETAGRTGREKRYSRIDQTFYYQKGKRFLVNPVIGEVFVSRMPSGIRSLKSDLTALGEQTMLGEPEQQTVAVPEFEKKELEEYLIRDKDQAADPGTIRVQLMRYNILALSDTEYVDPITLILSLSERDERVDQAVDELMEKENWYQE